MNHLRQATHALILTLVLYSYTVDAIPLLASPSDKSGQLEARRYRKKTGPVLTKVGKIVFGACFGGLAAIFIGIFVYANVSRKLRERRAKEAQQKELALDDQVGTSTDGTPQGEVNKPLPDIPPQYEEVSRVTEPAPAANPGRDAWKEGTTAVASMPESLTQPPSEPYVKDDEPSDHPSRAPFKMF
ncbi:hypothetical protein FRB90_012747 [Tulasnella sp. 427]|nr:hypothetical protein FRB90_012747 [Tulasnella sp. 427]